MVISRHEYAKGGLSAHLLRRVIHLGSIVLLWIYYQFGPGIAQAFNLNVKSLVWIYISLVVVGETLRISMGWTVFGQRNYEKNTSLPLLGALSAWA